MPEGIRAKKEENFSEWYIQLIEKAELIEYSPVSGCIILRPTSYAIWESITQFLDKKIKEKGVQNVYFPLLIPENLLKKESKHVEGFSPEVAWVTEAGDSKLNERLAIRPTSETIMYDTFKKWIRSYRDLPLLTNQWANVVRWEFKHSIPFLRTREFLWQEGHTVFATQKESDEHALEMLEDYAKTYEELLAVPVIKGTKTDSEKFAGADITYSIETLLPNGKAIQAATSHCLGQNFSKAFDIKFIDKDEKTKYVYQNSWGFTTRSIGIMIMIHSDNKGLVLPPKVAMNKVVIIPILMEKDKERVIGRTKILKKQLEKYNPILDDRDDIKPGNKFNNYEMKGLPIRIELGPRDLEKNQAVIVRRDTGEKRSVNLDDIDRIVEKTLDEIQKNLYIKAKEFLDNNIIIVDNEKEFEKNINKKIVQVQWCGNPECEESIKKKYAGVKALNIPFEQKKELKNCFKCSKKAIYYVNFAKSY